VILVGRPTPFDPVRGMFFGSALRLCVCSSGPQHWREASSVERRSKAFVIGEISGRCLHPPRP